MIRAHTSALPLAWPNCVGVDEQYGKKNNGKYYDKHRDKSIREKINHKASVQLCDPELIRPVNKTKRTKKPTHTQTEQSTHQKPKKYTS